MKIKIGLLPLYIELYDKVCPSLRSRLENYYEKIAESFEEKGFTVCRSKFCRLIEEFQETVSSFEDENVTCIITLHMAYSPSLMSAKILAETKLPIIVLDTTETYSFGSMQNPDEIMYCHGIHGVMDMCNLLIKNKKNYAIAAGHWEKSNVISRTCEFIKAAFAAKALFGMKVGSLGGSFDGMGDFAISDEEIKRLFGIEIVYADGTELKGYKNGLSDAEIENEIENDLKIGEIINPFPSQVHKRSVRDGLCVRKWIDNNNLGAFTINFSKITKSSGLDTMPFMEACKAMARGTGYAGEGDVLTAAFCGALRSSFEYTSFVEIFCPDWEGESVMISHMGEMNYSCASGKIELKETEFIYGDAENPIVGYGCFKNGNAVFVNVFNDGDKYNLLISPVDVIAPDNDNFKGNIRGWIKPKMPLSQFLEKISYAGATHHSIIVYDTTIEALSYFGSLCGLNVITLN